MLDIGIELGTTNILIYIKGKGIVLNEPSVVSIDTSTKKVLAVGKEAKEMLGRTPGKVKAIKPMKDGVIADFETTEEMLKRFVKKAVGKNILRKPRILTSDSLRIAGNTFDEDIMNFIKNKYKLIIGEKTSEDIKKSIGTVLKSSKKTSIEITGRGATTGLPETITVVSDDIIEALKDDVKKIVEAVKLVLEKTPPELAADISDKGIILTGGGALIDGLVEKLRKELKVPVFISDNPLTNVAEGTGILLDNLYLIDN